MSIKTDMKYFLAFFCPGAIYILHEKLSACLILIVSMCLWVTLVVSSRAIVSTYGFVYLFFGLFSIHIGSIAYEMFNITNDKISMKIRFKIVLTMCLVTFHMIFFSACILFGKSIFGIKLFSITSISMAPTIQSGDILITDTWVDSTNLSEGDTIVFRHPFKQDIYAVKRINHKTDEGLFFVTGDNLDNSVDSRAFGAIPKKDVVARATTIIRGFKLLPIKKQVSNQNR